MMAVIICTWDMTLCVSVSKSHIVRHCALYAMFLVIGRVFQTTVTSDGSAVFYYSMRTDLDPC